MAKIKDEKEDVNLQFISSACHGNITEMQKMLLNGANINFITAVAGKSALMIAVEQHW